MPYSFYCYWKYYLSFEKSTFCLILLNRNAGFDKLLLKYHILKYEQIIIRARHMITMWAHHPSFWHYEFVLPILELQMNRIILHILFWIWLISFRIIFLRFIQVVVHISNSLFYCCIPMIWIYYHLYILLMDMWVVPRFWQLWRVQLLAFLEMFLVYLCTHFCQTVALKWVIKYQNI